MRAFAAGDRVAHSLYGDGTIVSVDEFHTRIQFDGHGLRVFVSSRVNLDCRTPEEYGNPFEGEPIEDWITEEKISRDFEGFGPHSAQEPVQIVLPTHETKESSMLRALGSIAKLDAVKEQPYMIRIESL